MMSLQVPTAIHVFVIMHPWGTKKHQNSTRPLSWNTQTHGPCVFFPSRIPIPTTPLKTNPYIGSCLNTGNSARFIGFLSYKKNRLYPLLQPNVLPFLKLTAPPPENPNLCCLNIPLGARLLVSWWLGPVVITISSIFFQDLWKSKMEKRTCNHLLPGNSLEDLFGDSESWPFEWRNRIPSLQRGDEKNGHELNHLVKVTSFKIAH